MTIFIAEDNPADVYLLRIAFEEAGHGDANLVIASDGEDAMAMVERKGRFRQLGRPDLIILDLNLPKSDGGDILRCIRQRPEYNKTPVVVLTSSDSPSDRASAQELGASCYLTKPSDLEAFIGLGRTLVSLAQQPNNSISAAAR